MSNRKPRLRKPGRPAVGTGVSRDAMLDAAAQLFASQGVGATTLKQVALASHATPALVHYYFGNKDQLAEAVMNERLAAVMLAATAPLREPGPVAVESLVASYTRAVAANPWVPQLLVREVLSDGGVLRERFIERVGRAFGGPAPARLAEAQKAGTLRADLDPKMIFLSMVSLLAFPFVAVPVWREVLGFTPGDAFIESLIRHTTTVLMHGIEERPNAKRPRR